MAQQTTTVNLSAVSNTVIKAARYTAEFNAPSYQLCEAFNMPRGTNTLRVPKVGKVTIQQLTEGEDIVDEEDIGLSYVDLTTNEYGGKLIATYRLIRQNGTTPIWQMVGRQFGEAGARIMDTTTQALYASLNGATVFGTTALTMSLYNLANNIAKAKAGAGASGTPFNPSYVVHGPYGMLHLARSLSAIGASTNQLPPDEYQNKTLKNFWRQRVMGVEIYESGNLVADSSSDITGVIAERSALARIAEVGWTKGMTDDKSRRAWEFVFHSDWGVAELDDRLGAPLKFTATAPSDT